MLRDVLFGLFSSKPRRRSLSHRRTAPLALETLERRDYFAGVTVSPLRGLNTSEEGGFAIVNFVLTERPTANVTIPLSLSDVNEGILGTSAVVFTPDNFSAVQSVRITGKADGVKDGNKTYQLITGNAESTDPDYTGLVVPDATLTNKDSRKLIAGVTVSKTSGLSTTEDGGTASFTVKLNFKPTANVLIPIFSDNPNEGEVSVSSLVFTPGNFDQPQTVTVTGQADGVRDGTKTYHVVNGPCQSTDPLYNGREVADVTLRNRDSRTLVAGIQVTPTTGLQTNETGGSASFNMVLTFQPTANVTIPISSSNFAEGVPQVNAVTFTPQDWNVPQQVLVSGQDDGIFDKNVKYNIITGAAASADPLYANMNAKDVAVTNLARTDVGRFDGIYEGTYAGTVNATGFGKLPVSGPVRAEIRGGVVTVTVPGNGFGTLAATGTLGFGVTSGDVDGAKFAGSLKAGKGTSNASAKGTWKFKETGVTASGTWNITRIAD